MVSVWKCVFLVVLWYCSGVGLDMVCVSVVSGVSSVSVSSVVFVCVCGLWCGW